MNKSQQDGLVGPPAERSTEGNEEKNPKGEAAATKLGWTKLQKYAKNY